MWSGGGPFDRVGDGELLPDARELFEPALGKKGWELEPLRLLYDKIGALGLVKIPQAWAYQIKSPDGSRSYIGPLVAKRYLIRPEGRPWYSVSEKVRDYALQFDNVVWTYVKERGLIYVSDVRSAAQDKFGGGLAVDFRFGERYYGWYVDDVAEFPAWLDNAAVLKAQTKLVPEAPE